MNGTTLKVCCPADRIVRDARCFLDAHLHLREHDNIQCYLRVVGVVGAEGPIVRTGF